MNKKILIALLILASMLTTLVLASCNGGDDEPAETSDEPESVIEETTPEETGDEEETSAEDTVEEDTTSDETVEEEEIAYTTTVLSNCDELNGAFGAGAFSLVSENAPEGCGYYSSKGASPANAYISTIAILPDVDFTDYIKSATINFKAYIDNTESISTALLTLYDHVENKTTPYNIPLDSLSNGWNDISIPLSSYTSGGEAVTKIWAIEFATHLKTDKEAEIGMDDLTITAPETTSELEVITSVLTNCDNGRGAWGEGHSHVTEDAPEGTGYFAATHSATPVICVPFDGAQDISAFKKGYVSFKLYVNDPTKLSNAVGVDIWDITANGANTIGWSIAAAGLQNGWNDIVLNFADATSDNLDYTTAKTIRIFSVDAGSDITIGIDDVKVGRVYDPNVLLHTLTFTPGEGTGDAFTADGIETESEYALPACPFTKEGFEFKGWSNGEMFYGEGYEYFVAKDETLTALWIEDDGSDEERDYTEEYVLATAYENSVLNEGSDNHKAAIAKVMQKAENGEEITLVFLGDSITQGAGAGVRTCYAALVSQWWDKTFPDAKINYINNGIGSTEGMLGAARVPKEVIGLDPDFVVFDFGTNDYALPYGQEAFEGIVAQLKAAGIAFLNSNACPRNGNNLEDKDAEVNTAYGVPQIGFKSAYLEFTQMENAPEGFSANRVWTTDNVHPSDRGHFLIADLINHYLEGIYAEYKAGNITPADLDTTLPTPVTANGYADAYLLESTDTDVCTIEANGFEAFDIKNSHFNTNMHGWKATEKDSTIKFTTDAGYFQLFFHQQSRAGSVEIYVDGKLTNTFNIGNGSWPHQWHNAYHTDDGKTHTVEIKMTSESPVVITAIGLANFAD